MQPVLQLSTPVYYLKNRLANRKRQIHKTSLLSLEGLSFEFTGHQRLYEKQDLEDVQKIMVAHTAQLDSIFNFSQTPACIGQEPSECKLLVSFMQKMFSCISKEVRMHYQSHLQGVFPMVTAP